MRCVSFCTAKSYDLTGLIKAFKSKNYTVKTYRSVCQVNYTPSSQVFIFANGCFIAWGLSGKFEKELLDRVRSYAIDPLEHIEKDQFIAIIAKETKIRSHERFNIDIIELSSDETQLKLAISFGLMQSIKLESYEERIKATITKNTHLVEELAAYGKITLSRKAINRRMGEIFLERASINLKSEYIDIPEYFWEYPSYEVYYVMIEQFLDLPRRVAAINHKLDILNDTFQMLTTQLEHSYSTILEYIIIILIAIEVVFSFIHFIP